MWFYFSINYKYYINLRDQWFIDVEGAGQCNDCRFFPSDRWQECSELDRSSTVKVAYIHRGAQRLAGDCSPREKFDDKVGILPSFTNEYCPFCDNNGYKSVTHIGLCRRVYNESIPRTRRGLNSILTLSSNQWQARNMTLQIYRYAARGSAVVSHRPPLQLCRNLDLTRMVVWKSRKKEARIKN